MSTRVKTSVFQHQLLPHEYLAPQAEQHHGLLCGAVAFACLEYENLGSCDLQNAQAQVLVIQGHYLY